MAGVVKPAFAVGAVILAAGASSRMGRPKMLLPWGERTVLGHLLAVWSTLARQIGVVAARGDEGIAQAVEDANPGGAHLVENPHREDGMFSSIQCAARWNGWKKSLTHFAIALGDQPNLNLAMTLAPLLRYAEANPALICQPSFQGRAKHPVILPQKVFSQLRDTRVETLKEFLALFADSIALCPLDDPALALDIDVPADYERAHRMYFGELPR